MNENQETTIHPTNKRSKRAMLIFNPSAGATRASPIEIVDVIHEMQAWKLVPEAYLVEPGWDLEKGVQDAVARGIRIFVVCGGDGTISAVARTLAGTRATLGIIPIGTQNNTALSLGIPADIADAIAILRTGRRIKVDVGMATCGKESMPFLEVCSVGLISTLFPSADDIQHGNLARVGDFLTTLAASPPAEIHLLMDGKPEIHNLGHVVLVSNMPYIGLHYQVGTAASFKDGLLDVLFFADLTKLDLLNYVFQGVGIDKPEDPRIQHFHVHKVVIKTNPIMPVMVDGTALGEGQVSIEVRRRVLAVMVGLNFGENLVQEKDSVTLA
ncbi:sphingosine kinase and enzymes related to eukaryotic diacylglycerol kinase [Longilinea arvoryzae]|uniref:Sphingosine kinase and enzymes related to eukaryotic diacylglycerol kinase n=1 Tax=Longilinea arvoryzae TaxID=360412 RepID=A0A0S7BGC2_9CHLR|nr:diacylglycerol kinase family protein [Longilinea arvoryzae]GAP13603.1 sphingosine kinase and enzymes related to eukaryotic diacylglycerol kinase [Longilinea arvoryzae]